MACDSSLSDSDRAFAGAYSTSAGRSEGVSAEKEILFRRTTENFQISSLSKQMRTSIGVRRRQRRARHHRSHACRLRHHHPKRLFQHHLRDSHLSPVPCALSPSKAHFLLPI